MRHAVKHPDISRKPNYKPASALDTQKKTTDVATKNQVKPKVAFDDIHRGRAKRSQTAQRSQSVQHFAANPSQKRTQLINPARPSKSQQAPQPKSSAAPAKSHDQLFDEALASATSHAQSAPKQPAHRRVSHHLKRHPHIYRGTAALIIALALVGVLGYLDRVQLQLKMVSFRAGFQASLPNYHPNGYNFKYINQNAGSGAIVASFADLPANQSYKFVQQKSNWNSQTLLQNYVATASPNYSTYEVGGQTVYVYGGHNATWVNGGIWYQLHASSANLSDDQLLAIARST
jgi:hypothetical protein